MFYQKVPPPLYPIISFPADTSNFDDEFTKELPVLTPTKEEDEILIRAVDLYGEKNWEQEEVAFFRETTKEEDEILIRAVDLYGEKNWEQGLNNL
ncbi:hypothetical protein Glove_469g32 [Diversispora epigaea]|uniref:Uncharacterized protein n=1 Tax=Diversispora epigaea TaxID=1348612 RepID=A0A397GLR8_9GLOM|nr:hypothetical protein Glove_469g32 [Diversispora epigaea]